MYFTGNLQVDPSEATKIETVEPSGIFGKLLNKFGSKNVDKQTEVETFTAISILQQLYKVLKALQISNVIKLCHDDDVFYQDEKDDQNDLDTIMMQYELETNEISSESFKTLSMNLEHDKDDIRYIIKVSIRKHHRPGEYPIEISVKGLNTIDGALSGQQSEIRKQLQARGERFIYFLNQIDFYFRRYMAVDDIDIEHDVNLVIDQQDLETIKSTSKAANPKSSLDEVLKEFKLDLNPMDLLKGKGFDNLLQESGQGKHFRKHSYSKTVTYSTSSITIESHSQYKNDSLGEQWIIPLSRKIKKL